MSGTCWGRFGDVSGLCRGCVGDVSGMTGKQRMTMYSGRATHTTRSGTATHINQQEDNKSGSAAHPTMKKALQGFVAGDTLSQGRVQISWKACFAR